MEPLDVERIKAALRTLFLQRIADADSEDGIKADVFSEPIEGEAGSQREGLPSIQRDLGACMRCKLADHRRQIVFGAGHPDADLLIIGEAPGEQEDLRGEPFIGTAGQMLDKMLKNVLELDRSLVYISNIVKCRPPENRDPMPDEIESCRPFLLRQILAIRPKIILLLGNSATKNVLGVERSISKMRNKIHALPVELTGGVEIPVICTYHPASLLEGRSPENKRYVHEDLLKLKAIYDQKCGRRRATVSSSPASLPS